jgi:hypothetical protein
VSGTPLVWFRRDLRLHDDETLAGAVDDADEVLSIYVFDPRESADSRSADSRSVDEPKTGPHRAALRRWADGETGVPVGDVRIGAVVGQRRRRVRAQLRLQRRLVRLRAHVVQQRLEVLPEHERGTRRVTPGQRAHPRLQYEVTDRRPVVVTEVQRDRALDVAPRDRPRLSSRVTVRGGTSIRASVSSRPQRQQGCSVFPVYIERAEASGGHETHDSRRGLP